jgi:hypothetical protein
MAGSPDLAAAKRLLDAAKDQGFTFQRVALGPDGPLRGIRETVEFLDENLPRRVRRARLLHRDPTMPVIAGGARRTAGDRPGHGQYARGVAHRGI